MLCAKFDILKLGWGNRLGGGVGDLCQGVGGETEGGYYLIVFVFFTCVFVFCSLMSFVSFLSD